MQINSVTQTATPTASTTSNATSTSAASSPTAPTLGYNAFLQLLMAEMKNQDPTSPTDSTQWVSQLATFSNVQQGVQTNATLNQLFQNSNLSGAESLIGHTVTSADGNTSGVVTSVTVSGSGSTATLQNGATLPITSDLTVS